MAFRNVWIAAACFSIPGVVIACFLRNPTEAFNAHIDAPVEVELVKLQAEIERRSDSEREHPHAENQEQHTVLSSACKQEH